ncbi:MAG: hypothetical protein IJK60_03750 [Clostridia bacterium]|nr:hypothetical protein [Clostridia bacterium]
MKTKIKKTTALFMALLTLFGLAAGSVSAGATGCVEDTGGVRVVDYDGFKTVSPGFPVNEEVAQAVSDTDAATEWKTVSYTPYDRSESGKNTTYTVSAKGNQIKIVIKSDYINGDKIYCAGTKNAPISENLGKADEEDIFRIYFSDTFSTDVNTNFLKFCVRDACGENREGHYISASKKAEYSLSYNFYEEDGWSHWASVGQYYNSLGILQAGDYQGKKNECKKLNISTSGDTMTITTTLPDEVVDYYNESKRALNFDSENLWMYGFIHSPIYYIDDESLFDNSFLDSIITRIVEVFTKFYELLKKFFTFDF